MIGNNCNVNNSLADLLNAPFIGCGAHKFSLATQKWISNQSQVSTNIVVVALPFCCSGFSTKYVVRALA
jgi:hypothetical protein